MKLNKSESELAARNMARTNSDVNAMTVTEITALDCDARRRLAREYAANAAGRVDSRYLDAFKSTYEDNVLSIWAGKLQKVANARKHFKAMCDGITHDAAVDKIMALVGDMRFRLERPEPQLDVRPKSRRRHHEPRHNSDQRVYRYELKLKMSTAGSCYDLSEMAVLHKIHGELLDAANEVALVMSKTRVISKYGFPEEPAVVMPVSRPTRFP